ncbi:MAG: MmgE/PrpD family protein [Casimicrobiaceae bacterium]
MAQSSAGPSPRATHAITGADAGSGFALCADIAQWRYEDLPPEVVATVKRLVYDTIGVLGGGAQAPGIAELNRRIARWEPTGSATGLIGMRRCSPPSAALLNGAATHALDFDDLHDAARVHTGCVVLPTVLATAEEIGPVSGRDFLLAMAVGAELHARLGLACFNSLGKGWHPTMVLGTLAASLAAGRLLDLDAERLNHALGMAFHQASGSAQSMRDGVLSKRLGAGFAARAATLSAFLAKDGLSGTVHSLEGDAGLFALYERGEVEPAHLFAGLRKTWRIPEYSFKPYPCCRCNHTVIGLGIDAHRQGLPVADIVDIEVQMGHVNVLTVGAPYEAERGSVVHAQFSAAYGLARALVDGEVGLAAYQLPAITDARIAALARRIRVVASVAIPDTAIEPARVHIRMRDGSTRAFASDAMKGSPQAPLTDADFTAKFNACLAFGFGATPVEARRLGAVIDNMESSADAAGDLLRAFPSMTPAARTGRTPAAHVDA